MVLLLAGGLAAPAAGQDPPRELPAALEASTRAAIVALGDSLAREGLPARPLYVKAWEGHVKSAADARILAAVRSLAGRLRHARESLGNTAGDADLVAAANAFGLGVTADMVRRLYAVHERRNGGPSFALSLTVLADLVSRRVPSETAASAVEELMTRGAREIDLTELLRVVEQDIRGGRVPRDALRDRMQGTLQAIEKRRP
jgi:hypothetical protein